MSQQVEAQQKVKQTKKMGNESAIACHVNGSSNGVTNGSYDAVTNGNTNGNFYNGTQDIGVTGSLAKGAATGKKSSQFENQQQITMTDSSQKAVGHRGPELTAEYLAYQGIAKDARILDVECGPGLCATVLRDKYGFQNFDGLDASPGVIEGVKRRQIYQNTTIAKVGDGNKMTFIEENAYDSVTLAGGQVKLDAYEELIRVCKPGGFIVSSMDQNYQQKVGAALDACFKDLEDRGLWKKVSQNIISKYYIDLDGTVFVYKVLPPRNKEADEKELREKRERFLIVEKSQKHDQSLEETLDYYKTWVKTYYEDLALVGYQAPALAAEYMAKQAIPTDSKILDVACGTGWCAVILRDTYGYKTFDGLDASVAMTNVAKEAKIYQKIHITKIGDGNLVPMIPDNYYDSVTFAGGLVSGHIKLDAFEELIRVCKPGGYIVTSMREENRRTVKEYQHMDSYLKELEDRGLWEKVSIHITPNYYMKFEGLTLVYRVI